MANEPQKVHTDGRAPQSAGAKVTVACKLPHGLVLRLFRMEEEAELVMGGGTRMRKVARPTGEQVVLHGNAVPFGTIPMHRIIGGYALTEGVDKDFFDAWLEQNKSAAYVRNGLVFAYEKAEATEGRARENASRLSGLEPLNKDGDPRVPKSPFGLKITEEESRAGKAA